mgnify:CR=1 FL=1
MDLFMVLQLLCGLALFLFGMNSMGDGLESLSGGKLEKTLEKMTNSTMKGFILGIFGNNRYGCRLCKLGNYETPPGNRYYYGCQCRHNNHFLDSQPFGY